jgi:hypothetical protein
MQQVLMAALRFTMRQSRGMWQQCVWLVEQGANALAIVKNGGTPLHGAAIRGSVAAMQWLWLSKGQM